MYIHSENLKQLRKARGITQKELGKRLGISGVMYSYYERGERRMRLELLCRIADILYTSTDYLLGRTFDPTPPDTQYMNQNKKTNI